MSLFLEKSQQLKLFATITKSKIKKLIVESLF